MGKKATGNRAPNACERQKKNLMEKMTDISTPLFSVKPGYL